MIPFFSKLVLCTVGIEACALSHHWARELTGLGHTVKLMPPAYVKPFVKRQKNDAADAEAICEAVQRPSMRLVPIKQPEQQAAMVLHRTRHLYVRQLTAVISAMKVRSASRMQTRERMPCEPAWISRPSVRLRCDPIPTVRLPMSWATSRQFDNSD